VWAIGICRMAGVVLVFIIITPFQRYAASRSGLLT
jgi:hypothetical protein